MSVRNYHVMASFLAELNEEKVSVFTNADICDRLNVNSQKASALIQSYQRAQNRGTVPIPFVIHRASKTRTRGAAWVIGNAARHAKDLGLQLEDDVATRILGAIEPSMQRIIEKNPKAKPAVGRAFIDLSISVQKLCESISV